MIKFQHVYWGYRNNNFGRVTIASEVHSVEDNTLPSVDFAVSFCSPKDMFVKKIGRDIATSRLQNKDSNFYRKIILDSPEDIKFYIIHSKIIDEIHASMNIPRWAEIPDFS